MRDLKKRILLWKPILRLVQLTKRISLPGFEKIPIYDVLVFFFKRATADTINDRAAAISFNVLMALPGVLIFLVTLVPLLPQADLLRNQLLLTLDDVIKDNGLYNIIRSVIEDFFDTERTGVMWFSILFIIFFSSRAVLGIMDSFDLTHFEHRSNRFLSKRWMAFKLTFVFILMVLVSMLILATQGSIKDLILNKLNLNYPWVISLINYSRWLVIFGLNYLTIALLYRYAPAVRVKWSVWSPGAVLATLLMILVTWIFSLYVANFNSYNKVYGSIGTIILLMNLIYINAVVLIIGFELNVSVRTIKAQSLQRIQQEDVAMEQLE